MATEKRLIDADALLEEHCAECSPAQREMCKNDPVCGSAMWIVEAPTVDAVLVVHGRWIEGKSLEKCSICGKKGFPDWRYCPNCGAKMDGGNEQSQPACTYNKNGHCMGQKLMPECDAKNCDRRK